MNTFELLALIINTPFVNPQPLVIRTYQEVKVLLQKIQLIGLGFIPRLYRVLKQVALSQKTVYVSEND